MMRNLDGMIGLDLDGVMSGLVIRNLGGVRLKKFCFQWI